MRQIILSVILSILFFACSKSNNEDLCNYVNPFIGTAYTGHTFPGACAPFGLIQASPETGNDSWRYCAGYNIEDDLIMGFAQTHISGTGCQDLGDILMFPFCGEIKNGIYKSAYNRAEQKASPGYYAVSLTDAGVDVEITASEHTAFYRYTYTGKGKSRMLLDMQSGIVWNEEWLRTHVLGSEIEMPDNKTITGHQHVHNWVERHYYFVMEFDKPYEIREILEPQEGEKAKRYILEFDMPEGETLMVKIAISTVGVEGAKASLLKESPGWDFNAVYDRTRTRWNDLFSRSVIEGTHEQKVNFYTSLYHLYIQPANIADIDGSYRGADNEVKKSASGKYYSTLSLWDTYRAAHPLYTILTPEIVNDVVNTMLAHYDAAGLLPIWTLWGKESYTMIGNHSVPVIADAYLKGFDGFDAEKAFDAVKASLTKSHKNSDWETYMAYGYYPFDIIPRESVSKTLESVYDDYAAAEMAKAMGKESDAQYFERRAGFYKNIFDKETLLMRGKDSQGNWREPFHPYRYSHAGTHGGDYTEGNAWQYTWHIQHDIDGLINLMGDKGVFAARLDTLFEKEVDSSITGEVLDVTGMIGQYAHGNEPCHHVAYLYNWTDKRYRTQELIREIVDRFYQPRPDGLCGNDDCGQMSAWYLFSAMGFYPVNPVGGEYIIGAPQVAKTVLMIPNGKTFTIKAEGLSEKNKYVSKVTLNGQEIKDFRIYHKDIMNGGELIFTMSDRY